MLLWYIGCNKDESWVRWIHAIYIKNNNWWDYKAAAGASWIVKHLCKVVKDELTGIGMQNWNHNSKYSISVVQAQLIEDQP